MNIEHHSNYVQKFKEIEKTLETMLTGYVRDWVQLDCPEKQKDAFRPIQKLAEKHGYKIGGGSTTGYLETPMKILIAEPAEDYDSQISGLLKELILSGLIPSGSVILSDGASGSDFTKHISQLAKEKKIAIQYNDKPELFKPINELSGYGRKLHAIEQRNYQAFAPALISNKEKIAVQKVGVIEALEGGIQQNLSSEEIPYLVFFPTGVKRDCRQEYAIDNYFKECIDKTAKRLGL
jgi:hypothetical protein